MIDRFTYTAIIAGVIFFSSCNDMSSENHGPIVLGDPSTIVTETDSSRLQDMVTDLNPKITPAATRDSEIAAKEPKPKEEPAKPVAETPRPPQAPAPFTGNGLNADFNIMSLQVPNLNVKQSGNPNLDNANGAVYTLNSGTINGNVLKVTANVTKVSQRYQSVIVLKNELGMLPLESLSFTSKWQPMKGSGNTYRITGLDERSMEYAEANSNAIRNAVSRAAMRRRFSRKKVQDWVNSVRNVRATNQKPLYVMLRSVMWKIDGKDASGKPFSKQIRVDIPL
ncbi:MAG: hypothetical protein K0Q79_192 [Flavipsychrobacter sp.]|jgi:hypothetical protein|nr:hypothetical protein [Flavipsychrobacter sp.]